MFYLRGLFQSNFINWLCSVIVIIQIPWYYDNAEGSIGILLPMGDLLWKFDSLLLMSAFSVLFGPFSHLQGGNNQIISHSTVETFPGVVYLENWGKTDGNANSYRWT